MKSMVFLFVKEDIKIAEEFFGDRKEITVFLVAAGGRQVNGAVRAIQVHKIRV